MTPYWQSSDGRLVIYHGRAEDVLPTLAPESVELLLTDPPYGVNWRSNRRAERFDAIAGDDGSLDVLAVLELACAVLRRRRHLYVFGPFDLGALDHIDGKAELIWDKVNLGSGDLAIPWSVNHEPIRFGVRKRSRGSAAKEAGTLAARLRRGSVLRYPRPNRNALLHPTEKPVDLLRQLIESSSLIGETVLDPFMGSGSTGEACKREDRRFIGIEIEEKYCEIAARRLEDPPLLAAVKSEQLTLMDPAS